MKAEIMYRELALDIFELSPLCREAVLDELLVSKNTCTKVLGYGKQTLAQVPNPSGVPEVKHEDINNDSQTAKTTQPRAVRLRRTGERKARA